MRAIRAAVSVGGKRLHRRSSCADFGFRPDGRHGFYRGTDNVVERILRGKAPSAGLAVGAGMSDFSLWV